jgi:hypothetical protein
MNAEIVATGLILLLTTAVATGMLHVPIELSRSPIIAVIMVIVTLAVFAVYPVVGLALLLFTVVLLFKRNVLRTFFANRVYGEDSIPDQYVAVAKPHEEVRSGPRSYNEFAETDASNPMIGPLQEGFEPAPYGDEQGAPVDGEYPKEMPRASESPDSQEYIYRPDATTGSNEFVRFGPNLDEKMKAFAY